MVSSDVACADGESAHGTGGGRRASAGARGAAPKAAGRRALAHALPQPRGELELDRVREAARRVALPRAGGEPQARVRAHLRERVARARRARSRTPPSRRERGRARAAAARVQRGVEPSAARRRPSSRAPTARRAARAAARPRAARGSARSPARPPPPRPRAAIAAVPAITSGLHVRCLPVAVGDAVDVDVQRRRRRRRHARARVARREPRAASISSSRRKFGSRFEGSARVRVRRRRRATSARGGERRLAAAPSAPPAPCSATPRAAARERPRVVLDLVRGVAVAGDRNRMRRGEGDEQRVRGRARRRVLEPPPVSHEARVHGLGSAQSVVVSSGLGVPHM